MIFKYHTAFALGLIAMVAGTYLIAKMRSTEMCCRGFARVVGWFVVITAFLGLVCSTYYSVKYMSAGYYCPSRMGHGKGMMMRHHGKGMHMPMMDERMEQGDEPEGDE